MSEPSSPTDQTDRPAATAWYQQAVDQVTARLEVDLGQGLSETEAARRLNKYGLNKLPEARPDTVPEIFFRQFKSPLIYLLLVAGVIVLALSEYIDAGLIFFVLLFNAIIGAFQEYKAQNTLQALKDFAHTYATVRRDGEDRIVENDQVVPGDLIILQEGEKVPADARLVEVNNLRINEAALTGESEPVSKRTEIIEEDKPPLGDQRNMVFKGTAVVAGNAAAVVVATGLSTQIGEISKEVEGIETQTPLQKNIAQLARIIIAIILVLTALIIADGLIQGREMLEVFKLGVAVIVSSIPEGLPVVITLILAVGVWRMSKRQVLIKHLQAVEALGQADVVAVDKTGTITKNELVVQSLICRGSRYSVEGNGFEPKGRILKNGHPLEEPAAEGHLNRAALVGLLSSNARLYFDQDAGSWSIAGDPTEAALTVLGEKVGLPSKEELVSVHPLLAELPFDSRNKYHAALYQMDSGEKMCVVTGAPEMILERSTRYFAGDEIRQLTAKAKEQIQAEMEPLSRQGYRLIAFAKRSLDKPDLEESDIRELVFEGFYAMRDTLRAEAAEAIAITQQAGIKMVMITGDHRITARAIAQEAGIFHEGDEVIEGREIEELSDQDLAQRLSKVSVFARVSPQHKLRIVSAYQKRGEIIAMTGDGVNDALSLISADLGISMGQKGTEVAKEASDLILLDDNISSITAAVEEGRNIYKNIQKVLLFLFSTNLGEIAVISLAVFAGMPLPVSAAQLIWINFVTESFLVIPLAIDPKEEGLLSRRFREPNRWFISSQMLQRMTLMAGAMTAGTLLLFIWSDPANNLAYAMTMAVTAMAVFQWFKVWNCRSDRYSIFELNPFSNLWLVVAFLGVIILQILVLYLPIFQQIFDFVPLSASDWGLVVAVSLSTILVDEIWKLVRRLTRN